MKSGSAVNGASEKNCDSPSQCGQFDQLKVSHSFKDKTYRALVRSLIRRGMRRYIYSLIDLWCHNKIVNISVCVCLLKRGPLTAW